jgi:HPt (histidine-containing phosphotransfer) domain-containing protein
MAGLKWDKEFALEQAADDADLLRELIEVFKESCTNDYNLIRAGVESGDTGQIADAAHSIKGAAASLGFDGIRDLALEMEKDSRAGRTEVARQRLAELEELLVELKNL